MRVARLIVLLFLIAACAGPRYTYDFGPPLELTVQRKPQAGRIDSPLEKVEARLSAGLNVTIVEPKANEALPKVAPGNQGKNTGHEIVPDNPDKPVPPADSKRLDGDVKRALIFTAGGLVALLIGGNLFTVVGGISLLIGLIFGIKWLLRK